MEWLDAGYGSEFAAHEVGETTLLLQVVNMEEDSYIFLVEQKHEEDKPWRGELLLEHKHPPFDDQTNPVCLLKIYSPTKEKCKEELIRKSRDFLQRCHLAIVEMEAL
jgi:hypothetical protein